jgi:hypothetical protein
MPTVHLDFNPLNADHRRAADWLMAQPDPAEAVVRLIRAANAGERRLRQWEEIATLLANEVHKVRAQMPVHPSEVNPPLEVQEDPESARRLDSLFE